MSWTERLNAYRNMVIYVCYDLPTKTKKQRRAYQKFVNDLEREGFSRMQYSIFIRPCMSRQNEKAHRRRVRNLLPEEGHCIIFSMTDKQFEDLEVYYAGSKADNPEIPKQLMLF